jgi:threonine 3-dehydrogenase
VIKPPLILGHEIAGEVVEIGARADGSPKGDLVSVESSHPVRQVLPVPARHAPHLRRPEDRRRAPAGRLREYLSIPAVCAWKNPPARARDRALLEPLGNAVYAASEAQVAGQNVAVFGCGPAGLFTVAACKALGAVKVIAVDVNPKHLEMAASMGATSCSTAPTRR